MKKIVSLLMAAVISIGMTATAFAANPKIERQSAALADVYAGDAAPGSTIFLPLVKDAFEGATEDLTAADVRTSKITVKHTTKSGAKAIDSVVLKENSSKKAGVLVTLVDPYTSTKPLDFEVSIYLYINGKRQSFGTVVTGTLTNEEEYVYADTDYIDLSNGVVAVCEESAAKVEAYLGNDVTMFVRMVKGKSYTGYATTEPTDSDIDILEQYPDIVNVYRLSVSGLSGSGKIVQLDSDTTLHVYDGDLNYLGTTDSLLTYKDKYFTSVNKLDVIAAEDEDYDDTDDSDDDYDYSDDDDYVPEPAPEDDDILPSVSSSGKNTGGNPDTGVSPLFGFSVMSGMLSLGVMGMASIKRKK